MDTLMIGWHGWVTPRADGARARCGGPALCAQCGKEAGLQWMRDRQREPLDKFLDEEIGVPYERDRP